MPKACAAFHYISDTLRMWLGSQAAVIVLVLLAVIILYSGIAFARLSFPIKVVT